MTDAEVYRRAAERVHTETNWLSCVAVLEADQTQAHKRRDLQYARLFKPDGYSPFDDWGEAWGNTSVERRECRVLALCLMAAIAESDA